MGIGQHHVASLAAQGLLQPSTFGSLIKIWNKFFIAIGASYLAEDELPLAIPDKASALDGELAFTIFTLVHDDYKHVVADAVGALASWKALKAAFISATLRSCVNAWQDFIHCPHDITRPVAIFITEVKDRAKLLSSLSQPVSEPQIINSLLSNLHPSFVEAKRALFSLPTVPNLKTVVEYLNTSSSVSPDDLSAFVKKEEVDTSIARSFAASAQFKNKSGGSFNNTSGASSDFRWGCANHIDQCRRCGRVGHIADRCVADMPKHIKDWMISGAPRGAPQEASFAEDGETAGTAQAGYTQVGGSYDNYVLLT